MQLDALKRLLILSNRFATDYPELVHEMETVEKIQHETERRRRLKGSD